MFFLVTASAGCASNTGRNVPDDDLDKGMLNQVLLASAESIQASIRAMESTSNALALKSMSEEQKAFAQEQMNTVPYGMNMLMTTQSYGSLRSVVLEAATLANYRFDEFGKRKKLYLTMVVNARPIVDVLRDAGEQVRGNAWVCVYPDTTAGGSSNGVVLINYEGECQ